MTNESEIWQRLLTGDPLAYAELFDLHSARVYRRALGTLGSVHDAEDVTAAAFFELWRKHRSIRLVNGSVLPWLLVTVVNLCRNHVRGLARYRSAISALPRGEHASDPADIVAHTLDGSTISDSIKSLGRVDAALLVLTAVEGYSTSEAAAALGLTAGAARMRLSRARTRVRAVHRPSVHALTEGDSQ